MPEREKITQLVEALGDFEQEECPVKHHFAPGVYIREIFMPKGACVIGKIHATEHFNIILKGRVSVICGDKTETFEAPYTFVSEAGIQKIVYMHEDCIWQTVHITDKTDLEEIEADVIALNYDDLDNRLNQGETKCLG